MKIPKRRQVLNAGINEFAWNRLITRTQSLISDRIWERLRWDLFLKTAEVLRQQIRRGIHKVFEHGDHT